MAHGLEELGARCECFDNSTFVVSHQRLLVAPGIGTRMKRAATTTTTTTAMKSPDPLTLEAGAGAVLPFVRPSQVNGAPLADELALVEQAKENQRTAQHALYLRYHERVKVRVSRLLGTASDVDDVLQDTFVLAFRDLKQLDDAARFGAWLCGIAVHQVHRRLRRRQLLQRLGFRHADEPTLSRAVDPAAGPEVRVLLEQLERALGELVPRQRLAWILRHVEGCSLEDVASQCGISLATTKRDITRAELHLHAQLSEQGPR